MIYIDVEDLEEVRTCSPDTGGGGWRAAEYRFVPLAKESVDHLPFIIRDGSLHLIYT